MTEETVTPQPFNPEELEVLQAILDGYCGTRDFMLTCFSTVLQPCQRAAAESLVQRGLLTMRDKDGKISVDLTSQGPKQLASLVSDGTLKRSDR